MLPPFHDVTRHFLCRVISSVEITFACSQNYSVFVVNLQIDSHVIYGRTECFFFIFLFFVILLSFPCYRNIGTNFFFTVHCITIDSICSLFYFALFHIHFFFFGLLSVTFSNFMPSSSCRVKLFHNTLSKLDSNCGVMCWIDSMHFFFWQRFDSGNLWV